MLKLPRWKKRNHPIRWRRLLGITAAITAAVVVGVPLLLIALLQTDFGRKTAVGLVQSVTASDTFSLDLGTIEGSVPFNMRLSHVNIADGDGPWLEIRNLALSWRAIPLLAGHVEVDALTVERIVLRRQPAPATETNDAQSAGLPSFSATLKKLQIDVLSIHERLPGGPATFSAAGTFALNDAKSGLSGQLKLDRLDEPGGLVAATVDYDRLTNRFRIDARVRDPSDGFLAKLFDRPGMPALELSLEGNGTPDAFQTTLLLTAGGKTALTGSANITGNGGKRKLKVEVTGDLAGLVPDGLDDVLGGPIAISSSADIGPRQAIAIDRTTVKLPGLTAELIGRFGVDGTSDILSLSAKLAKDGAGVLRIPSGGTPTTIKEIRVSGQLGKTADGLFWRLLAHGQDIASGTYMVKGFDLRLDGTANAEHVVDATRIPAKLTGTIAGIDVGNAEINALIGDQVTLSADAVAAPDGSLKIAESTIRTAAFIAGYVGAVTPDGASGRVSLTAPDLAMVAKQAGQPLAGRIDIAADGNIAFSGAPVKITLSGNLAKLHTGKPPLDGLIGGSAKLTGSISRDEQGLLLLDNVAFDGTGLTFAASGSLTARHADLDLKAIVKNLSGVDPRIAGKIDIDAHLDGPTAATELRLAGRGSDITLNGKPLVEPRFDALAILSRDQPSADIVFEARLADLPVEAKAILTSTLGGSKQIEAFRLLAGRNVVEGKLNLSAENVPAGSISIKAPDLSELSPFALSELAGAIVGRIDFREAESVPAVNMQLSVKDVRADTVAIEAADVTAFITDPLGTLSAQGTLVSRNIDIGGRRISKATVRATPQNAAMRLDVAIDTPEATLKTSGLVAMTDTGVDLEIRSLDASHGRVATKLAAPARISTADGKVTISDTVLAVGAGRISVAGTVADILDLTIDVNDLPLSIVNALAPGTGAGGTLNASAKIAGSAAAPRADWRLAIKGAAVAATRGAGLPALNADAHGVFENNRTSLNARLGGIKGLDIKATGSAPASPTGPIDIAIRGALPFTLISRPLADAGAALSGAAQLSIDVSGPAGSPAVAGTITTSGVTATHVGTGTVVRDLAARIGVTTDRIRVESLTGRLDKGGQITASGEIGISDPAMPGELKMSIRDGRYVDGTLLAANFAADLKVAGRLAVEPKIAGKLTLDRLEINIPENIPGGADLLAVKHKNAPDAVKRQVAEIAPKEKKSGGTKASVDLAISAPARIFIRGRGLDAELGGTLTMRGPLGAPLVDGGFSMRRGRLNLLSRRLDFERGIVTFAGDFDPRLDFAARTKTSDTAITIKISGSASSPDFSFSSSPELPQDEVLARFLFDRGIDKLSPLQLAQLASEIAKLSGRGGGPGVVERIRRGVGVDRLEATTDDEGKSQVSAGKYIADNIYLGVKQGTAKSSSKVTIDLDVTDNVKARGEVGNDGSSKAGIYFETDY